MDYKLNANAYSQMTPKMEAPYGGKDQVVPMFVPIKIDVREDGPRKGQLAVPVTVGTRKEHLEHWVHDGRGEGGGTYTRYAYQYILLILTLIALPINVYLAGALAFATGFMRSEYLYCVAWNIDWFKGKSYIAVK